MVILQYMKNERKFLNSKKRSSQFTSCAGHNNDYCCMVIIKPVISSVYCTNENRTSTEMFKNRNHGLDHYIWSWFYQ